MIGIKNILVPTDFSPTSDAALMYGRELAGRFGATLHLMHVVPNLQLLGLGEAYDGEALAGLQATTEANARTRLAEWATDPVSDGSGPPIRPAVMASTVPTLAIVEYAKNHAIDLIIMGTHGHGPLTHLIMGSVAERVVRIAPCPVLTVRHPEHEFVWPDTLTTVAHA